MGCHFLLQCMKVKSESEVAQSCLTLCDPMDCSPPGSSVLGFSRQEYWSGLPFPSPGHLPNLGIEPESPALQADSLPLSHQGRAPGALAAAAKSLQSCPILCDPIDGSPAGSPVPGTLQARTLEWVAIAFSWCSYTPAKPSSRLTLSPATRTPPGSFRILPAGHSAHHRAHSLTPGACREELGHQQPSPWTSHSAWHLVGTRETLLNE